MLIHLSLLGMSTLHSAIPETSVPCPRTLEGHDGIVLSCQFSLSGDHVLSNDEKVLKVCCILLSTLLREMNGISCLAVGLLACMLLVCVGSTKSRSCTWFAEFCSGMHHAPCVVR